MDDSKRKMLSTPAAAVPISRGLGAFGMLFLVAFGLLSFTASQPDTLQQKDIRLLGAAVYQPGENLTYRVHYGFLTAGEASLSVNPRVYEQNDRICYKIDIFGRSVGAFRSIVKIHDTWTTFLDTAWMKPHRAMRDMQENNYRLQEDLNFDYDRRTVFVKRAERRDTSYRIPNPVYDIVSGYYYLRQVDFSALPEGTVLVLDAFFDNQQYKFKIRFDGRATIKTKYGRVPCLVLKPLMPDNAFFDGENAITLWMSDDANRIPVKVSAELVVGSVDLDITGFTGTRTGLTIVKR